MRIAILAVGRLKDGPERELLTRYTTRFDASGRSLGLGPITITEMAESRATNPAQRKSDEAARLSQLAAERGPYVALDEGGKALSSEAFARWVAGQRDAGHATLSFLIGGPDGHGETVLKQASLRLSLGAMTLPHGLARIVLAEQLYRAATILSGHPYHRA